MIQRNPDFALYKIKGAYFLLPFGQAIADQKRGLKLNEPSVFLWQQIENGIDGRAALLDAYAAHYEADTDREREMLSQDLDQFFLQLEAFGILIPDAPAYKQASPDALYLQIGPIRLQLNGPRQAFSNEFLPFRIQPCAHPELTVSLQTVPDTIPGEGILRIRNDLLCVLEYPDRYLLRFPSCEHIIEAYLSHSGSCAGIYCRPVPAPESGGEPHFPDSFIYELFHAVRFLFLYTARRYGCFALHSASILYKEQAWLFSGHSGMGKSTHTALWHALYKTPLVNGDLNLLSIKDGKPVVYGIPWCGTSGISSVHTYPLGGIVLLKQAANDQCDALPADEQALMVSQRLISPAWDADMLSENLDFTSRLTSLVSVCMLKCTKQPSAAKCMKQWIDAQIP